jgi:hypothetical protein
MAPQTPRRLPGAFGGWPLSHPARTRKASQRLSYGVSRGMSRRRGAAAAASRDKADSAALAAPLQPIAPRRPTSWRYPDTLLGDAHPCLPPREQPILTQRDGRISRQVRRSWMISAEPFSRSWTACPFFLTPSEPAHTAMRHSKVSCGRMDVRAPDERSNRRGSSLCQRPPCDRPKLNN